MTGAAREKDQADFDLERFIDMFDEALTSKDERVVNALRSLMMMTILTKSETYDSPARDRASGPLRRMYEDMHHLSRRLSTIEEELRAASRDRARHNAWAETQEQAKNKIWPQVAAAQMAQDIDEEVMRNVIRQINSPAPKAKGLLDV